jgi:signal transduction histidine kinase
MPEGTAVLPLALDVPWGIVIAHYYFTPRTWVPWEVEFLQQCTAQLAIALRQSQLYQAAQAQVKELQKFNQLKDDFLSSISHELRTPIANIKMVIRLLMNAITNSGVEIPAEAIAQVFDKFYRVPNNDPWKHGGTGLGLALVKKLVEHLDGRIEVRSGNNLTCFTVILPLSQSFLL